jgi:CubicO group peptidase (beta-lactamase class C family)
MTVLHRVVHLIVLLIALQAALLLPAVAGERDEQIYAYLARAQADSSSPGVSAAVMVGGKLVFSGGVGQGNVETAAPLTGRSVHNIGSISKTIAVVAVMQLMERGKVALDSEIQTYLPWFPRKEHPVTVRQLLTHTSGIGHYDAMPPLDGTVNRFKHYAVFEESTRWWRDQPLIFKPMQHHHYSSFATNLMQGIVEAVSGMSFEGYLLEHVWAPAGMLASALDVQSRVIVGRSRGYRINEETQQLEQGEDEDVSYKYAGGGMVSSDEDLVRFGHALNTGRLLSEKTLAEMYRSQLPASMTYTEKEAQETGEAGPNWTDALSGAWGGQGLIWLVGQNKKARPYAAHSGGVKSTSSYLQNYYRDNVVVAVHMNGGGAAVNPDQVAVALAELFLEDK